MSLQISNFVERDLNLVESGEPVAILLHGYGSNERDLPSLMDFLPKMPWAALRAPLTLQQGAYAWYGITTPLTPTLEEVEPATDAVWDWIEQHVPSDSPLVILGFSQGGLMATQLLRTHPERIIATVILAGFRYQGVQPADERLLENKPKVFYGRGVQDTVITKEAVASLNIWLQSHTRAVTKTYEALGHSIDARVMNDVAQYLSDQLRVRA
ncbi:MAG: alpha/beta hydrolase [Microbacteriaceae bacterium]